MPEHVTGGSQGGGGEGGGLHVSKAVSDLMFLLTGERFPTGRELHALAASRALVQVAEGVDDLVAFIDQSVRRTAPSFPEQVRDQFVRSMSVFTGTGGGAQRYLVDFSGQLRQVSGGVQKTASDILETKWELIAELVRLLIELAVLAALEFFFPGTATAAKAALMAQARLRMLARLLELLRRGRALSLLMAAFHEGVDEAFQSLAVRLAMMRFAPAGLRPGSVDWRKIGEAALVGSLMGGFFKPIHTALGAGRQFLPGGAKGLGKGPSGLPGYPGTTPGTSGSSGGVGAPGSTGSLGPVAGVGAGTSASSGGGARHTYDFFNDATSEGLAESFAEMVAGGMLGRGWNFSVGTALGAGLSSMSEQVLFGGVALAAGAYQKWRGSQTLTSSAGGSPAPVNPTTALGGGTGTGGGSGVGAGTRAGTVGGPTGRPHLVSSRVPESGGAGVGPDGPAARASADAAGPGGGRTPAGSDPRASVAKGASAPHPVDGLAYESAVSDRPQAAGRPGSADRASAEAGPGTVEPSAPDTRVGRGPATVSAGVGQGPAPVSAGAAGVGRVRETGGPQAAGVSDGAAGKAAGASPESRVSGAPPRTPSPAVAVPGPAPASEAPVEPPVVPGVHAGVAAGTGAVPDGPGARTPVMSREQGTAARTADWVRQVLAAGEPETGRTDPVVAGDGVASHPHLLPPESAGVADSGGGRVPVVAEAGSALAPVLAALGLDAGQVPSAGDGLLGALVGEGQETLVAGGGARPVATPVPMGAGERLANALAAELDRPSVEGRPLWDALDGRAQAAWGQGLVGGGSAHVWTVWGDDQRHAVVGALHDLRTVPASVGQKRQERESFASSSGGAEAAAPGDVVTVSGADGQETLGPDRVPDLETGSESVSESGTTAFDHDASSVSSGVSDDLWETRTIATGTDATSEADEPGVGGAGDRDLVAEDQAPRFWNDLRPEVDKALRDLNISRTIDAKQLRELYTELPDEERRLSPHMRDLAFRIAARIAVPGGRLGLPGGAQQGADERVLGSDEDLFGEDGGSALGPDDDLFGEDGGSALGPDDDLFGEDEEESSADWQIADERVDEARLAAERVTARREAAPGGTLITLPRPAAHRSTVSASVGPEECAAGGDRGEDVGSRPWTGPEAEEPWGPPEGWADRQGTQRWFGWATPGRRGMMFRVPFAAHVVREVFAELRLPGSPVRTLAEVGELLGDRTQGALPDEAVLEELQARFVAEEVARIAEDLIDPQEQGWLGHALDYFRQIGNLDLPPGGLLLAGGEAEATELGRWLEMVGAGLVVVSPSLASALARMGRHTGGEDVRVASPARAVQGRSVGTDENRAARISALTDFLTRWQDERPGARVPRYLTAPSPDHPDRPLPAGALLYGIRHGGAAVSREEYEALVAAGMERSSSAVIREDTVPMTVRLAVESLAAHHTPQTRGTRLPRNLLVPVGDGRRAPLGRWIGSVRNGLTAVSREDHQSLLGAGMEPSDRVVIREDTVPPTPDIAFPLIEEYYRDHPSARMPRNHLARVPPGAPRQHAGVVRLGTWLDDILRGSVPAYEGDLEDLRRAGVAVGDRFRIRPGSGRITFGGRRVPPRLAVRLLTALYRNGDIVHGSLPPHDLVVEDDVDPTTWHLGEWAHSVEAGDTRLHPYLHRELVEAGMPLGDTALPVAPRAAPWRKITPDTAPHLVSRWLAENPGSARMPGSAAVDGFPIGHWIANLRYRKISVTGEQHQALAAAGAQADWLDAPNPDQAGSGPAVRAPTKKITLESAPGLVERWFEVNEVSPESATLPATAVVDGFNIGPWLHNLGNRTTPVSREQYRALVEAGARVARLDATYPDLVRSVPAPSGKINLASAPELVRRWFVQNPGSTSLPVTAVVDGFNIGPWIASLGQRSTPVTREQYQALVEAGARITRLDTQYPDVASGDRPSRSKITVESAPELVRRWFAQNPGRASLPAVATVDGLRIGPWIAHLGYRSTPVTREQYQALVDAGARNTRLDTMYPDLARPGPRRPSKISPASAPGLVRRWFDENPGSTSLPVAAVVDGLRIGPWIANLGQRKTPLTREEYRALVDAGARNAHLDTVYPDLARPVPAPLGKVSPASAPGLVRRWFDQNPGSTSLPARAVVDGLRIGHWIGNLGYRDTPLTREQYQALVDAGARNARLDTLYPDLARPVPLPPGKITLASAPGLVRRWFDQNPGSTSLPAAAVVDGFRIGTWVANFRARDNPATREQYRALIEAGVRVPRLETQYPDLAEVRRSGEPTAARAKKRRSAAAPDSRKKQRGSDAAPTTATRANEAADTGESTPHRETDGAGAVDDDDPNALSQEQIEWLGTQGVVAVPSPADGDCFYHSLGLGEPALLRQEIALHLTQDLHWAGQRLYFDATLDAYMYAQYPGVATLTDEHRQAFIQSIATPGSWGHVGGDATPVLAARVLNVRLHVYRPDTRTTLTIEPVEPTPGIRDIHLVYLPARNHWLAATAVQEAFRTPWENAPGAPDGDLSVAPPDGGGLLGGTGDISWLGEQQYAGLSGGEGLVLPDAAGDLPWAPQQDDPWGFEGGLYAGLRGGDGLGLPDAAGDLSWTAEQYALTGFEGGASSWLTGQDPPPLPDPWDFSGLASQYDGVRADLAGGVQDAAYMQAPPSWNDLRLEVNRALRDLNINRTVDLRQLQEVYAELPAHERQRFHNTRALAFRIASRIAVPGGRLGLPGGARQPEEATAQPPEEGGAFGEDDDLFGDDVEGVLGPDDDLFGDDVEGVLGPDDDLFGDDVEGVLGEDDDLFGDDVEGVLGEDDDLFGDDVEGVLGPDDDLFGDDVEGGLDEDDDPFGDDVEGDDAGQEDPRRWGVARDQVQLARAAAERATAEHVAGTRVVRIEFPRLAQWQSALPQRELPRAESSHPQPVGSGEAGSEDADERTVSGPWAGPGIEGWWGPPAGWAERQGLQRWFGWSTPGRRGTLFSIPFLAHSILEVFAALRSPDSGAHTHEQVVARFPGLTGAAPAGVPEMEELQARFVAQEVEQALSGLENPQERTWLEYALQYYREIGNLDVPADGLQLGDGVSAGVELGRWLEMVGLGLVAVSPALASALTRMGRHTGGEDVSGQRAGTAVSRRLSIGDLVDFVARWRAGNGEATIPRYLTLPDPGRPDRRLHIGLALHHISNGSRQVRESEYQRLVAAGMEPSARVLLRERSVRLDARRAVELLEAYYAEGPRGRRLPRNHVVVLDDGRQALLGRWIRAVRAGDLVVRQAEYDALVAAGMEPSARVLLRERSVRLDVRRAVELLEAYYAEGPRGRRLPRNHVVVLDDGGQVPLGRWVTTVRAGDLVVRQAEYDALVAAGMEPSARVLFRGNLAPVNARLAVELLRTYYAGALRDIPMPAGYVAVLEDGRQAPLDRWVRGVRQGINLVSRAEYEALVAAGMKPSEHVLFRENAAPVNARLAVELLGAYYAGRTGGTRMSPGHVVVLEDGRQALLGRWVSRVRHNGVVVSRAEYEALVAAGMEPSEHVLFRESVAKVDVPLAVELLGAYYAGRTSGTPMPPGHVVVLDDGRQAPLGRWVHRVRHSSIQVAQEEYERLVAAGMEESRNVLFRERSVRLGVPLAVELLGAYYAVGIRTPVPTGHVVVLDDGRQAALGRWVRKVRSGGTAVSRAGYEALVAAGMEPSERVRFRGDVAKIDVPLAVELLGAYYDGRTRGTPIPYRHVEALEDGRQARLGEWVYHVRHAHSQLGQEEYRRLVAAGMEESRNVVFRERATKLGAPLAVELLGAYYAGRTGGTPIPRNHVVVLEGGGQALLGRWVHTVRSGSTEVSREEYAALVAAGMEPSEGVLFSGDTVTVDAGMAVELLGAYYTTHTRGAPLPGNHLVVLGDGKQAPLGRWVSNVRRGAIGIDREAYEALVAAGMEPSERVVFRGNTVAMDAGMAVELLGTYYAGRTPGTHMSSKHVVVLEDGRRADLGAWVAHVRRGDSQVGREEYEALVAAGMEPSERVAFRGNTVMMDTRLVVELLTDYYAAAASGTELPTDHVVMMDDGRRAPLGRWIDDIRRGSTQVDRDAYEALLVAGMEESENVVFRDDTVRVTAVNGVPLVEEYFRDNPRATSVPRKHRVRTGAGTALVGEWLHGVLQGHVLIYDGDLEDLRHAGLVSRVPNVKPGSGRMVFGDRRVPPRPAVRLLTALYRNGTLTEGALPAADLVVADDRDNSDWHLGAWAHSVDAGDTRIHGYLHQELRAAGMPLKGEPLPPPAVRKKAAPSRPRTKPITLENAPGLIRDWVTANPERQGIPRAAVVDGHNIGIWAANLKYHGKGPVTRQQYEALLNAGMPNIPRLDTEHGFSAVSAPTVPPRPKVPRAKRGAVTGTEGGPSVPPRPKAPRAKRGAAIGTEGGPLVPPRPKAPRAKRGAVTGTEGGPPKRRKAVAAKTSTVGPADAPDTSGLVPDQILGADRAVGDLADPSLRDPNALPLGQVQWLQDQGIDPVATPPDGDCFYHALGQGDPASLRRRIGTQLRHDLDSSGPRTYFDAMLDAYLHAQHPDAALLTDDHRRQFIASIETPGSWAHTAGDATPSLAARILNLRLHIHRPGNRTSIIVEPSEPLPGVRDIHLVYALDRNHWLAATSLQGEEEPGVPEPGPAAPGESGTEDPARLDGLLGEPPPDAMPDVSWMDDVIGSLQPAPELSVPWGDLKAEVDRALRDMGIDRTVEFPELQELYRALPDDDRRLAANTRALALRIAAGVADPYGLLRMRGGARSAAASRVGPGAGGSAAAGAAQDRAATGQSSAQRTPAAARPGPLTPTEARRLAAEAVAAEAAEREIREINPLVDRVASWFGDAVRQAQVAGSFTPTADLARLFVGLDPRLIGSVVHEVLPYLAGQPDLLARISPSLRVRVAVLTQPGFAQFLMSRPNLLNGLYSARTTGRLADHVPSLMRYPEVAKALETDAELRGQVLERMSLINDLGGKLPLIRVVAKQRWLQNAVTQVPQVAEALRSSNAPMAAIRPLKENLNLLLAITHHPGALPDAAAVRTFLEHTDLVRAIHRNPQQADLVFRVPGLLGAVRREPGLLEVLGQDEDLADVLSDTPEPAGRLARSPRLLRAAFGNPQLAEALSYDPSLLDVGLDDVQLERRLRSTTGVAAASPEAPRAGARPVQRLLADPRVRAAVRGDNELGKVLLSSPDLVSVLLEHPDLLQAPHEYRRLLRPANAALREQITPGSPLLAPGVLRAVLRSPGGVYESLLDRFSAPGTADAGPEDPRRIFAAKLARGTEARAAAQADPGARQMLLNQPRLSELLSGVVGLGEAIRREGRLLNLIDKDPFLPLLLKDHPETLPALLANDSALLELALSARNAVAALRESPELIGNVVAHPRLLRALAHENDVTPSTHWRRLFDDTALLDVLGSGDGLVLARALALAPDVLTDALARDAFITEVKQPSGLEKYVELSRRTKELAREVQAADDPDITRSGIEVDVRLARVARAILDAPALARRTIVQEMAPEHRERYQQAAEAVLRALREIPKLRSAIGREFGIILGMLSNDELAPLLLKRPALVEQLADHTGGALKAVYGNPVLTRGLRENGRLYLRFTTDRYLVQALASSSFAGFAEAVGRNRRYLQAFDAGLPTIRTYDGDLLLQASEVLSAVVVDDKGVRADLAMRPLLLRDLMEMFYGGPDGMLLTGADWEAAEAVARAVAASPVVLRAMAGHPELLDVLAGSPALACVLAENPEAVSTEADVVGLLRNERLVAVLDGYPEQAGVVLRTPGLLPVVMRTPALVGAMARSERLAGLLGGGDVRALLGERPEVAEDLVRVPELVDALGGLPGLVGAVRAKPAVAGLLRENPGLLAVLRARRTLVDDLARDTALWRASVRIPALVEALSQSARVLRHLRRRPGLVGVLASNSARVAVPGPQLLAVLSDDALTALLDGQPRLAGLVLGSPELTGRAVEDAGFVERVRGLSRDRGRFEESLRKPDRLLAELDQPREASRTSGAAAVQPPRKGASATPNSSSRPTAGVSAVARPVPDAEVQALVRRIPELEPLQRGHREVLVALARDEEVPQLLRDAGAGLLRRVVESPELAALVAAFPDLAEEWQSAARAEEFRFDVFLGRTTPTWDLERDFAVYEDRLGALDVSLHGDARRWVRGAVEPVWRAAEVAHRESVAAEERAREERLSRFRAHLPETWEYSGEIRYGNGLHAESFTGAQLRVLTALVGRGSRPRERVFGVNQAVHAHLDGGSGGVSFAYVLGADGRVDLLVYGLSSSRQGNDYRWDGNGSTYVSGPLPLEAVEDAPALLASQDLVTQAGTRRAGSTTSGRRRRTDPGAVRGVPDAEPEPREFAAGDPAAEGLLERPGPIEPPDADALVAELSGLPTAELRGRLELLPVGTRLWLASHAGFVEEIREALTEREFAQVAARLLVVVPEGVGRPASARQEAYTQVARMLLDGEVAAGLLGDGAVVMVLPKDVPVTRFSPFAHVAGLRDGSGRRFEELRGAADGALTAAVTEENLLGETTSVGPAPHMADGYSSVTHELAHLVHDRLGQEDRVLIAEVWAAKRARGGGEQWPDGVRLDLYGRAADNYSSTSADEYFAQLGNAYLGTNRGTDAATGRPRNNGTAYVRTFERELLPLLERLYGTDPEAVHGAPANPVTATAADDALYDAFRDAMALTGQVATPEEQRNAGPAEAGPDAESTVERVRSSAVVSGTSVLGRDFTGRWPTPWTAGMPPVQQLLLDPDEERPLPIGDPGGAPWQSGYLVHAELAPGTSDRIHVADARSGTDRRLTFAEFAQLLAADSALAETGPHVPVVLLVPGALSRGLGLLRAVRDAVDRPVWGHTGRALLFEETPGAPLSIGVLREDGRLTGQWLTLPEASAGAEPEPPGEIVSVDGETFDDADVILRPFATADGRPAGHWSKAQEYSGGGESRFYGAVSARESAHYVRTRKKKHIEADAAEPVAWSGLSPYFLNAHGRLGAAVLALSDGRKAAFSGEQVGGLLRRRRSFTELFSHRPIVTLVCWAAAHSDVRHTTFVKELADTSGHMVFGATSRVARTPSYSMGIADEQATVRGEWRVALPASQAEPFDRMVRDSGLVPDARAVRADDRMWMLQVLRMEQELHGPDAGNWRAARQLAALVRLHREAHHDRERIGPLTRNSLDDLVRRSYDWDPSTTVISGDITHLLELVEVYRPRTLRELYEVGRVHPPVSVLNPLPYDYASGRSLPYGEIDRGGSWFASGTRGAPPAPGAAPAVRSAAISFRMPGGAVVGREFTDTWDSPFMAALPQWYHRLDQSDGPHGGAGFAPAGEPVPLPRGAAGRSYVVHARTDSADADRIWAAEADSGEVRALSFADFARVVASDAQLAALPMDVPVLLLVPGAAATGLGLLRAVRDATGRPVWGHTGQAVLFEEGPDEQLAIGVVRQTGRVEGQWVFLPLTPAATQPLPPGKVTSVRGRVFDDADLVLRPFADLEGRIAGHWSFEEREFVSSFENKTYGAVRTTRFDHIATGENDQGRPTGTEEVPWARWSLSPYFLQAHGTPGEIELRTRAGRGVRFSGEQVGGLLRRRRSFAELFHGHPVVALACSAAVPAGTPSVTTSFVQDLANGSGHTAFGAPDRLGFDNRSPWLAIPDDEVTGEPRTWKVAFPEPQRFYLDRLAHDSGLLPAGQPVTKDDRTWMLQALRTDLDLHGMGARNQTLRALAALLRLHRAAPRGRRRHPQPFNRDRVVEMARAAFGWDASRPVAVTDIAHLLALVDRHRPADVRQLAAVGRAAPPAAAGAGAAAGPSRTGVRGAPPGPLGPRPEAVPAPARQATGGRDFTGREALRAGVPARSLYLVRPSDGEQSEYRAVGSPRGLPWRSGPPPYEVHARPAPGDPGRSEVIDDEHAEPAVGSVEELAEAVERTSPGSWHGRG